MDIDDQFSLDSKEEVAQSKVTQSKSMKTVYEQLAKKTVKQENAAKLVKKQKRAKVQSNDKPAKAVQKTNKPISKQPTRGDNACKYIKNRALESQLKEKALSGVLKIMNMISKTQAQRNVE